MRNHPQAKQVWWVYDRWCERSRGKPQHPKDLQLDVAAMQEAAGYLVGMHDFSTFQDSRRPSGKAADDVRVRCLLRSLFTCAPLCVRTTGSTLYGQHA